MKSRIFLTLIIISIMFIGVNAHAADTTKTTSTTSTTKTTDTKKAESTGLLKGWFKKDDADKKESKKTAKKSVKKPKRPEAPVNRLEEERYKKNPAVKELDMLRAKQQKAQMEFTKKYNAKRQKIMDKYRKKIQKERKKEINAAVAKCRERVIDNMIKGEDRMGRLPY